MINLQPIEDKSETTNVAETEHQVQPDHNEGAELIKEHPNTEAPQTEFTSGTKVQGKVEDDDYPQIVESVEKPKVEEVASKIEEEPVKKEQSNFFAGTEEKPKTESEVVGESPTKSGSPKKKNKKKR